MASVRAAGGRPLLRNGRARTLQPYLSNSPRAPVRDAWSPAKRRRPVVPSQMPRRRRRLRGAKSGFGDQDTTRAKRSLRKRHCSILRLKTAPTITAKRTFRRLDASMQSNRLDGRQLCACVRFDSHSVLRFTVAAPVWLAERVCHARGIGCGLVDSAAYGHVFEQARTPDRRQTVLPVVELFYR